MNITLNTTANPYLNPAQPTNAAPPTADQPAGAGLVTEADSAVFSAEAQQLAGDNGLGSDFPSDPGGRP